MRSVNEILEDNFKLTRFQRITERTNRDSNKHSKSRRKSSTDSEDSYIKRRLQKEIKDKEESYQKILQKWEERERRLSKQYAKDEEAALELKKMLNREAKKLKQFLEDYEDERDDPKFYKYYQGASRNYEHVIFASRRTLCAEQKFCLSPNPPLVTQNIKGILKNLHVWPIPSPTSS